MGGVETSSDVTYEGGYLVAKLFEGVLGKAKSGGIGECRRYHEAAARLAADG